MFDVQMSSFNLLNEVQGLEEALKCKVCNDVLVDPLLIAKCGHTMCKLCFTKNFDLKCPVCDIPVNTKDSLEDKQLKDLLAHLKKLKELLQEDSNGNKSLQDNSLTSAEKEEPKVLFTSNATGGKDESNNSDYCTPKVKRNKKVIFKNTRAKSSANENIIQETPQNSSAKKTIPNNVSKSVVPNVYEKRKSNSSTGSPNTTIQSPVGNINKKNHKGETLLHRAVIKGDIGKVKDLLQDGANVNTQDNNGWTPLHEASNHGFVEIAKLLLDHGALVNVPSLKDNITPLHDALINDQMQIAILLVSRGADLHAKTSLGNTALDLCKNEGDRNILIESCSPFISANVSALSVKNDNDGKVVFLPTSLNDSQKAHLLKCAQMLKADIVDDLTPEVSHIVTTCDNMGNCTRTKKILMGILSGKWIVNYNWIEVCLEYKQKVDEEVFEVQGTKNQPNTQGPKHSRENMEQKFPLLFDGFYFYLHGNFTKPTPEREDLCNLIHVGGGKILAREPRPETVADSFTIPYHASGTALEDTNHIILYQDKPPRGIHVHSGHICTLQVMWLIECISEFKILKPSSYVKK